MSASTYGRIGVVASVAAAIFVLFAALLDPRVSAGLAVVLLLALAAFQFVAGRQGNR